MTTSRREFLSHAAKIGAGTMLGAATLRAAESPVEKPAAKAGPNSAARLPKELSGRPALAFVQHDGPDFVSLSRQGDTFTSASAEVRVVSSDEGADVRVSCPKGALSRVILRWDTTFPSDTLFLGDHWERSYGDLQWRFLQPERIMPWYFAAHRESSGETFLAGVKTQPAAMCFWLVDGSGISLWLDFRNGGSASIPGDREITAATIISSSFGGETPLRALTQFCRKLSPAPRLAPAPICGNNNWYYAYGLNFDANAMRRDAGFLADLAGSHSNRPYCVIDAGWTPGSSCPGGPWTSGDPKTFPDMPGLAADMKKLGVRPGIWMRPTALTVIDDPRRLRPGPAFYPEKPLDLTLPENLQLIRDDIARVRSWGYDLIKHDFSTYDVFAKWGMEFGADFTDGGWHFADRSLTNAEIILRVYRTLREGAGDIVLLGCNTIGHLGAGIFEIQRTGDDTSGKAWERTRRMGINTLAYRLSQHGTFFAVDADCAAHTEATPWEFDRQFLDLVARSGTALFISVDPRKVNEEQRSAFRAAMQLALSGGTPGGCEPLDWLHSTAPRQWRFGSETVSYHWEEPMGVLPFRV